ncbi:MAG: hypothetical protein HOE76_00595 [Euryarchaeota archaeon]|jgi:glutaredoxin|nr:hypothetical protein [Euryarchaeota archaeon]MBT4982717.1 hypothetical protein [Euryarchaeota archaeon]MBT5184450.1 hypothetical protein [Euryarchaeota archaeon]
MAKKKGGIGRLFGAITGSPYERLQKQIDKMVKEASGDKALAKTLKKLVTAIGQQYDEENIDDEEHDLLIEAIEEVDPKERTFPKLNDDSDEFYDGGDMPDSPKLTLGKRKNLDDLMKSQGTEFTGSFGRDEFEEFRQSMSADFYAESDDAVAAGDHQHEIRTQNRVFADADEEIKQLKKQMSEESGIVDPTEEEADENYYTDDDGVEWWKDDDGYWWYREPGQDDWQPHE